MATLLILDEVTVLKLNNPTVFLLISDTSVSVCIYICMMLFLSLAFSISDVFNEILHWGHLISST